jgi:hypothetical protein
MDCSERSNCGAVTIASAWFDPSTNGPAISAAAVDTATRMRRILVSFRRSPRRSSFALVVCRPTSEASSHTQKKTSGRPSRPFLYFIFHKLNSLRLAPRRGRTPSSRRPACARTSHSDGPDHGARNSLRPFADFQPRAGIREIHPEGRAEGENESSGGKCHSSARAQPDHRLNRRVRSCSQNPALSGSKSWQ